MNHPTIQPCCHVYRIIQAHCAIRASTRIGQQLRELAGAGGDIAALPDAIIEGRLPSDDRREAARLRVLARENGNLTHD